MTTIRKRFFPVLALFVCCAVVAAAVSRATAADKQNEWEEEVFQVEVMTMHLEMFGQLIDLIQGMHEIADDPSSSGVMAVMSVDDYVQGEDRIDFLNDMLNETDDPTVRRSIRIKLMETHKEMGNTEEALEQIEALISAVDED